MSRYQYISDYVAWDVIRWLLHAIKYIVILGYDSTSCLVFRKDLSYYTRIDISCSGYGFSEPIVISFSPPESQDECSQRDDFRQLRIKIIPVSNTMVPISFYTSECEIYTIPTMVTTSVSTEVAGLFPTVFWVVKLLIKDSSIWPGVIHRPAL